MSIVVGSRVRVMAYQGRGLGVGTVLAVDRHGRDAVLFSGPLGMGDLYWLRPGELEEA